MKKHKQVLYLILLITTATFCQVNGSIRSLPLAKYGGEGINIVESDVSQIRANIYLFPTFSNLAIIETASNKKYSLSNLNFNLYSNSFESKINKDSVYILSFDRIESIKINNKLFKKYLNNTTGQSNIYQVIHENEDVTLFRDDKIVYSEIRDPLGQSKPKVNYQTVTNYYLKSAENSISKFRFKKKSILALFGDKQELVMQFAKENKISYKEEKDLKRLFNYYYKL